MNPSRAVATLRREDFRRPCRGLTDTASPPQGERSEPWVDRWDDPKPPNGGVGGGSAFREDFRRPYRGLTDTASLLQGSLRSPWVERRQDPKPPNGGDERGSVSREDFRRPYRSLTDTGSLRSPWALLHRPRRGLE